MKMPSTPCRLLHLFADGEMPFADRPAFHRHLATCASCQDELELVMMLDALATSFADDCGRPALRPEPPLRRVGPTLA
jgi:anti-sigma factor RsiW